MTKIIRNNRVYGGTPTNLGDIQNVDITSPTNNQALVYDSTTNKWKNDNVSAVGSLNDLTDVTISSVQNKQELVYNSTSTVFENKTTRIELTQAQYNALTTPETDVDYYITDAPSMSGTSADLSYDGTSKSVYTKIGEMDTAISGKADSSSLATVAISGSYNDLLNKPTLPAVFSRCDVILNVMNGTLRGWGSAVIHMQNGIARIDFNVKIGVDETVSNVGTWGINRDYFTALTGKTITPLEGGVVTYYHNEQIYTNRIDFGGTFLVSGQFWKPARVYDDNGTKKVGGWVSSNFASGDRFIGTVYGTYT